MSEVLKTPDGTILKNTDGLVLKGNYDFGKVIINPARVLVNYVLDPSKPCTLCFFAKVPSVGEYARFVNKANNSMLQRTSSTTLRMKFGTVVISDTTNEAGTRNLNGMYFTGTSIHHIVGGTWYGGNTSMATSGNTCSDGFEMPLTTGCEIGDFYIFTRAISAVELAHLSNFGMGNEPLKIEALACHLKLDKAEILDFSVAQDGSVMKVGCRNYGSIPFLHGEITGLPAGTLQEQANYANANYFKSW